MFIFSFRNPILLRTIGTTAVINNSFSRQESVKGVIEVFSAIISVKDFDRGMELVLDKTIEFDEDIRDLRFIF